MCFVNSQRQNLKLRQLKIDFKIDGCQVSHHWFGTEKRRGVFDSPEVFVALDWFRNSEPSCKSNECCVENRKNQTPARFSFCQ